MNKMLFVLLPFLFFVLLCEGLWAYFRGKRSIFNPLTEPLKNTFKFKLSGWKLFCVKISVLEISSNDKFILFFGPLLSLILIAGFHAKTTSRMI